MRDSSLARNNAAAAMSSGWIRPSRWDCASLSIAWVAGHQALHPIGHGGRRSERVDPHLVRRELDRERTGERGDPALGGGVAVPPGDPHQGEIGRHVDHAAAAGADQLGDGEAAAEEGAEQIEPDDPPELFQRRVHRRVVLRRGAAGVVVQDVDGAEMGGGLADGGGKTVGVGDVGAQRDGVGAGAMGGFLAGGRVQLGDGDVGAFGGEQRARWRGRCRCRHR